MATQLKEGTGDRATRMFTKEMERRSMMASKLYQRANLDSISRRERITSLTNPKTEITSRYIPSRSVRELQDLTASALKKSTSAFNNQLERDLKPSIQSTKNKEEFQSKMHLPNDSYVIPTSKVNFRNDNSNVINNRVKHCASSDNVTKSHNQKPGCKATHRSASQSATETVDVKFCTIPNKAFQDYMKRANVADHKVYRTIMLSSGNPIDSLSNLSEVKENFERSMKHAALKAIPSVPPKQINGHQRKYSDVRGHSSKMNNTLPQL